ncbi:MAG: DUF3006 domain-containing protein [Clostridia bacterium]|nr:DUF3006 domain-containing protein [Clostridia bacterium]
MSERFTVDRIEDGIAVLEGANDIHITVSAALLPDNVKESDILIYENGGYTIDEKLTAARKEEILKKHRSIFNKK